MLKYLLLVAVLMVGAGCEIVDSESCSSEGTDPDWSIPDGIATALVDGRPHEFRVYAQPIAYDDSEVVLRAYSDSLSRTLMLTFDLWSGRGGVDREMTGFWDLGMCIPTNRYVITDNSTARVRVENYDCASRRLWGTFEMEAVRARAPEDEVTFAEGAFEVRLRHEPFEYCIEG